MSLDICLTECFLRRYIHECERASLVEVSCHSGERQGHGG